MNRTTPRHERREGGFTLIELLVVLIIVGILMAIAATTFGGSKTTVKRQEAIVAAHSLQKAVEGFRRDREGRVPSTAADWPTATRGPVDADVQRPYMRALHPVNVALSIALTDGTKSYTPVSPLSVGYQPAGGAMPTTYRITVRDANTVVCVLTNGPIGGSDKPC